MKMSVPELNRSESGSGLAAKMSEAESKARLQRKQTAGGSIFTSGSSFHEKLNVSHQLDKLIRHQDKGLLGKMESIHSTITGTGYTPPQTTNKLGTLNGQHSGGFSAQEFANLKLSEDKLANIKSPTFLKLDSLINHLGHFRKEFLGNRIPKYEQQFLVRKEEAEQREHDAKMQHEIARLRQKKQNRLSMANTRSTNHNETPRLGGLSPRLSPVNAKQMNDSRSLSRKLLVERYRPNAYDKPLKSSTKDELAKRSSVRFDQDFYEKELAAL